MCLPRPTAPLTVPEHVLAETDRLHPDDNEDRATIRGGRFITATGVATAMATEDPALETMRPATDWDPATHERAVETFADETLHFRVWGGDWCPDCRERLPPFAAALAAAGVGEDRLTVYPVERVDGEKQGPGMSEFGVDRIPTVIVERDGEELARFVEESAMPISEYLCRRLHGDETGID